MFRYIKKIEKEIIDLEKNRISKESKDIYGKSLGFYSPATENYNSSKKAGSPFTGLDTGDWFDGFYMQIVSGVIRFSSKDPKNNAIITAHESEFAKAGWLSGDIFGLSDKDLRNLINQRLKPFFIENLRITLNI